MNKIWYQHFMHKEMFVFTTEEGNNKNVSGWDCKGNKFENKFHFIDGRYKKVEDPEQIELLNVEFKN